MLALLTGAIATRVAIAADSAATAEQISDQSFTLLNLLNAQSGGGKSNPALGAIAIFAGDAQTLSHALTAGDRAGAAAAMATLEADRASVDQAGAANPGAFDRAQWTGITKQLDALAKQIPAAPSAPRAAAIPAAASSAGVSSSSSIAATAPAAGPAAEPASAPPRVVIDSRTPDGSSIRIKGYLEGTHLTRGGLYDGAREDRDFNVAGVLGEQRLNFEIDVGNPTPDAAIRVYDAAGRMAEAPVNDAAGVALGGAASAGDASAAAPAIPPLPAPSMAPPANAPTEEGGVEVFRNRGSGGAAAGGPGGANIAEIPSHGAPRRSPSKRRTIGSQLANVQIDVISTNELQTIPPTYEVIGQIHGRGITHAGIYLDGRPVARIAVADMSDNTSFDQRFVMERGTPTIRAYGVGDQFIETSLDLGNGLASADSPMSPDAPDAAMPGGAIPGGVVPGPMVGGTPGVVVQIAAVGAITPNLYVVSGVISGNRLSAAGLYQNGMLVQNIPVRSGGLGGMLGALIPGSHNVNFNVRFNPQAGPASIRAFGASGGYAEQPVVAGGGYGVNPYAGVSPYGSPYGAYGPGMSPYANPYGTTPYATNPYSSGTFGAPPINNYTTPTNPFAPPAGGSSW
ncbi:MAG TPA: hypothetical protein VND20_06900 [Candidatus Binataceae bacterium]|nr:hypothetical protein [Candidatus Binataceae bacterium]